MDYLWSMTKKGDIAGLLHLFFIQYNSVSVPGIGSFDLYRVPAQSDFATRKVIGPSYTIHFDSLHDLPSKEMFNYIARKKNISDWEAIRLVNEFAYQLKDDLKRGHSFSWEGIGMLKAGSAGNLVFEPERVHYSFLPRVHAERVIRRENEHSVLVGERERQKSEMQQWLEHESVVEEKAGWWVVAAIITAVALLLIFFSLVRHDYAMQGSRQSTITPASAPPQYETKTAD